MNTAVSNNKLELSNPKHIYQLIRFYSGLKETSSGDLTNDMRCLIEELEDLIDNTPLQPHEKDILVWKIDGLRDKPILKLLKEKHGKKITQQRLSKIYLEQIPQQIVDTYLEKKFDWHYIYKLRGRYKRCSKCGEIKLAHTKYFSPYKRNRDGLHSRCRKCR